MADPVAYSMFAPTPAALDTSPLMEGARVSAAAIIGAGRAIGQGITDRAAAAEKEDLDQEFEDLITDVTKESNYTTEMLDPSSDDPELAGLPRMERVLKLTERGQAQGLSLSEAQARAQRQVEPIQIRYLKPDKAPEIRARSAKMFKMAPRLGVGPEAVQRMLDLAGGNAELTALDARRKGYDQWVEMGRAGNASNREMALLQGKQEADLQAERIAAAERQQAIARNHDITMLQEQAGVQEEQADTAWGRGLTKMQLEISAQTAMQKGEWAQAEKVMGMKNAYERDRMMQSAQLEGGQRMALAEYERESALLVEGIRSDARGGLPEGAQRKAMEFTYMAQDALSSGAAYQDVPLDQVAGMVNGLSSFATKDASGKMTAVIQLGSGGEKKRVDISDVRAKIGEDGQPTLTSGTLDATQLEALKKSVFRNSAARDALAITQVTGGLYQNSNDLEQLRQSPQAIAIVVAALSGGQKKVQGPPEAAAAGATPGSRVRTQYTGNRQ